MFSGRDRALFRGMAHQQARRGAAQQSGDRAWRTQAMKIRLSNVDDQGDVC